MDVTASGKYKEEASPNGLRAFNLVVSGLNGGHSGMDIHRGLGNANKIMNRILLSGEHYRLRVARIEGGSLRNAIPRESVATILIPEATMNTFKAELEELKGVIQSEYLSTDPELSIELGPAETPAKCMAAEDQARFLRAVQACPNGIYRMSPDVDGLTQTSNNLARIELKDGNYTAMCLTRSSVDSEKMDEALAIRAVFELIGAKVEFSGSYPGWTPRPGAGIVKLMSEIYRKRFNGEPHVLACHAGLECGILGTNYPQMEMISFGPNIKGAHSPDERVQISSVQKFWGFLLETLDKI